MTGIPGWLEWRETESEKSNFTVMRGPMYCTYMYTTRSNQLDRQRLLRMESRALLNMMQALLLASFKGDARRFRDPRLWMNYVPFPRFPKRAHGWEPNKSSMLITRIFTIGPSIPVSGCYYMWDLKRWAPNNEKKRLWWTTHGKRYVICSHPTSSSTHTPWEALNHHEQLPRSISLLSFIHSVER